MNTQDKLNAEIPPLILNRRDAVAQEDWDKLDEIDRNLADLLWPFLVMLARWFTSKFYSLALDECDLAHDAYVKITTVLDRYDPNRPFVPWTVRICYHLWIDTVRQMRREIESGCVSDQKALEDLDDEGAVEDGIFPTAVAENPETVLLNKEQMETFYEELHDDPELEEVGNAIRDGCEIKPRFLADWLDTEVEDINRRMKRFWRRLRRWLEDHKIDDAEDD